MEVIDAKRGHMLSRNKKRDILIKYTVEGLIKYTVEVMNVIEAISDRN